MFQRLKTIIISKVTRVFGVDKIIKNQRSLLHSSHYLNTVSSVIHIGANIGQERELYETFALKVIWVEPLPEVFEELKSNIATYKSQSAIQALLTDVDNQEYKFNVASNGAASSSILAFKDHKDIWPDVDFVDSLILKSKTLVSLIDEQGIDPSELEALVIDTQGAELLVLKGAESILKNFRFITTEVADFESYSDCCTLDEVDKYLRNHGFRRHSCSRFARRKQGGAYFNITYENRL